MFGENMAYLSDEELIKWLDTHIELRKQLCRHGENLVITELDRKILVYGNKDYLRICRVLNVVPTVGRLFPDDATDPTIVASFERNGYRIEAYSHKCGKEFYDYVKGLSN